MESTGQYGTTQSPESMTSVHLFSTNSYTFPPPLSHTSSQPVNPVLVTSQTQPVTTISNTVSNGLPKTTEAIPIPIPPVKVTPPQDTTGQGDSPVKPVKETGLDDPESGGEGLHTKLVLRLKKTKIVDFEGESESFEKQEISKNDSYCWVCHEGGEVLCCDHCPRVFHMQCSGLGTPPDEDAEWVCPVCKNISRKPKRSRPHNLKELLLLAINRMMFPGTEIFQKDIPEDIIAHYREYIFYPMHMGMIKEKVNAGGFQSTREFLHETEWILHNCIIYNGGKHALTKIAKGIVKVCKEDMREIELCPSCYGQTVKQPADWFCIPCNPPHKVVLAKVRGYPLWPAKLISETSDKCDVRFFGQHDRSLVQRSSIQTLNGPPPAPATKTAHWTLAMEELAKYRNNINLMLQHIDSGKTPEEFIAEKMAEAPKPTNIRENTTNKIARVSKKEKQEKISVTRGQTKSISPAPPTSTHNGYSSERAESQSRESSVPPPFSISNHIPCSPQIVMVNPPLSESEETGPIHGNSASFANPDNLDNYSEPSSPGSDTALTIDLEGFDDHTRGKRIAPSATKSMLKGPKKTSKLGPEAYYNAQYGSTRSVQMITPSSYRSTRPGEALSLITHNLAEKLREQMPSSGSTTPGGSQDGEPMDTAFSSIYPPDKRAIAVVDPNAKRQPKRKRNGTDVSPLKSSKRIRNKKADQTAPTSLSYEGSTSLITGYESSNGFILGTNQGGGVDIPEDPPPIQYGEGLLADTMRTIDQSYTSRLDGIVGSTGDMGYQYFSEKLMSSIKAVVVEMLSIFESKGKAGAKQIKEHLHTAWPVPDSRSQLEKLRAELRQEMRQELELVRASADLEREQVVSEVRRQAGVEKELAIQETKKKKWCSYCLKEAQYNCCWNANYCNELCQQAHWPEHMSLCTQVQQQQQSSMVPRTPGPTEVQKMMSPNNIDNPVFVFNANNTHVPAGTGEGIINNNEQSINGVQPNIGGTQNMSGASFNMPSLRSRYESTSNLSVPAAESPMENSLMFDNSNQMVATVTTVPAEELMSNLINSVAYIEQIPNHLAMLVHPTSPQHFQSVMMSQTAPPTVSHTLHPPSPPSHGNSLTTLPLHAQPISPATPPQSIENPPSLHVSNTFSWPYQQPIAGMSHDLSQALPLLPQVPVPTPTTQPNSFFRVF